MNIDSDTIKLAIEIGALLFAVVVGWVTIKIKTETLSVELKDTKDILGNTVKITNALSNSVSELNSITERHEEEIRGINTTQQTILKDLNEIKVTLAEIKKDIQYIKK